jgi:hypothetical protein
MVVIVTELQDYCQEPRTMEELVEAGFKQHAVYNAVKKGDLKNTNAMDAWGRKQRGKGLFLSTVTPIPYNASLLVQAWNNQLTGENHVPNNAN